MYKKAPGRRIFQFTPLREGRRAASSQMYLPEISIHAPPRGATILTKEQNAQIKISIHAPPRGATHRFSHAQLARLFQFTPLREGRRALDYYKKNVDKFQFTPLREGRLPVPAAEETVNYFNSRPSARGDLSDKCTISDSRAFQFTPLREGRRMRQERKERRMAISIHAPPRGATQVAALISPLTIISIHAPPRGATVLVIIKTSTIIDFNSRPSARGDNCDDDTIRFQPISIHAPPRGATFVDNTQYIVSSYFNSRPSARGDSKRYAISANLLFNPYKSAWLNNRARQFVEIILVIFHRIIA